MRTHLLAALGAASLAWLTVLAAHAAPVDTARIKASTASANAGQWLSHGRDYTEQRYSPLKQINADNAAGFATWLADLGGWKPIVTAPAGVEASRLQTKRGPLLFLLNHTPERQEVSGLPPGQDLLTSRHTADELELPPFGVAVIAAS